MRWRIRRRRTAVASTARDDPYAAYLAWVTAGRPALQPADLMSGDAIALPPAADDVPEDVVTRPSLSAQRDRADPRIQRR